MLPWSAVMLILPVIPLTTTNQTGGLFVGPAGDGVSGWQQSNGHWAWELPSLGLVSSWRDSVMVRCRANGTSGDSSTWGRQERRQGDTKTTCVTVKLLCQLLSNRRKISNCLFTPLKMYKWGYPSFTCGVWKRDTTCSKLLNMLLMRGSLKWTHVLLKINVLV